MSDLGLVICNSYNIKCFDENGKFKWSNFIKHNLVVQEGRLLILDTFWSGSAYTAAHYLFITAGNPIFADGDTMALHPGWTEITNYSEPTRPIIQMGAASAPGTIDNDANRAVFTINQDGLTVGGLGATTDSTKGGAVGTLVGGDAFTQGNNPVNTGYILRVKITSTLATT